MTCQPKTTSTNETEEAKNQLTKEDKTMSKRDYIQANFLSLASQVARRLSLK